MSGPAHIQGSSVHSGNPQRFFAGRNGPWRILSDRHACGPELGAALADPDRLIAADAPLLKRGNSATVAIVRFDGRDYVVKRYNLKSLRHRLSRSLRPTRAAHSWHSAHRLAALGIATPRPVALVEQRLGPLRGRAWFVSEFVAGIDLRTYLQDASPPPAERRRAIESTLRLLGDLGAARISHGDLKATNILITGQGEAVITDLDALRCHRFDRLFRRARARDLARLRANWPDRPDIQALFDGIDV